MDIQILSPGCNADLYLMVPGMLLQLYEDSHQKGDFYICETIQYNMTEHVHLDFFH